MCVCVLPLQVYPPIPQDEQAFAETCSADHSGSPTLAIPIKMTESEVKVQNRDFLAVCMGAHQEPLHDSAARK